MYASPFRRAAQNLAQAQNQIFGEPVTVIPTVARVNMQAQPDANLKPCVLTAYYAEPAFTALSPWPNGRDKMPQGVSRQGNDTKGVISSRPSFSFAEADLPYPIKQKYQIVRCNGETFEVVDPRYDGYARVKCDVNRVGRPSSEENIQEAKSAFTQAARP